MLQITNLDLSLSGGLEELRGKAARLLGVAPGDFTHFALTRRSIDARRKDNVHFVCSLRCALPGEDKVLAHCRSDKVSAFTDKPYRFPAVRRDSRRPRPVVVGMGPAGLFAALFLARGGVPSIVLERGRDVDRRTADVERFWATGDLSPASNVQFGEGGAGTFSDGKLNTGTHDGRIQTVLETFVRHGAPEDILWQQKPHVGTDLLRGVVKSIRQELIALGCDVRFEHRLAGLRVKDGRLVGLEVATAQGPYELPCDALVLAPGHSARDTFQMLLDAGVPMEPKPFAIGVRVEHDQAKISEAQYGPAWEQLAPADYKLACHLPDGRGVFSFCVCPGGQVVAAASDHGQVVTNGMSYRARDGKNINGGLLVSVNSSDFTGPSPLSGVGFQARWERAAWDLGQGGAPVQVMEDFLKGRPSARTGAIEPTYRPGVTPADLEKCLPPFVTGSLRAAIPQLGRRLRGFDDPGALLTGVETRSSSPVRILRGENCQSPIAGLYPCGEGCGWAGGITSAAVDGIRVAERIAQQE